MYIRPEVSGDVSISISHRQRAWQSFAVLRRESFYASLFYVTSTATRQDPAKIDSKGDILSPWTFDEMPLRVPVYPMGNNNYGKS